MEDHKYLEDSRERHIATAYSLAHVHKHIIAMQQPQLPVLETQGMLDIHVELSLFPPCALVYPQAVLKGF